MKSESFKKELERLLDEPDDEPDMVCWHGEDVDREMIAILSKEIEDELIMKNRNG